MKRTLALLVLLAVSAHPAEEDQDAAALQVAIDLLEREGKTEEAARLTAMLERLPGPGDDEADERAYRKRVESLFDFLLAFDEVSAAEIEEQETRLAELRGTASQALEKGDFQAAATASQEAAALAEEIEVNRTLLRGATKRPASSSNAGLVSRLKRIEQRLDRIERLIRTRLR